MTQTIREKAKVRQNRDDDRPTERPTAASPALPPTTLRVPRTRNCRRENLLIEMVPSLPGTTEARLDQAVAAAAWTSGFGVPLPHLHKQESCCPHLA